MKPNRAFLATTIFFDALIILTFAGLHLAVAPVWFVFQRGTYLGTFDILAQISAWIATSALFIAAAFITVPLALEPAPRVGKLLNALPVYLLAFTLAAILANILGFFTLGSLTNPPAIKISLAAAWLGLGAVTSLIAVTMAALRANLNEKMLRAAILSASIALLPILVLCVAMLGSLNIVSSGQANAPAGQSAVPPGGGPPSGGPGGFGGVQTLIPPFQTGSVAMIVFAIVALVSTVLSFRQLRAPTTTASPGSARIDYRRQVGQAAMSFVIISVILLGVMQLVPVSKENPPVLALAQWDSPQTKTLVDRACMNCHSNETQWPPYALFAPGSWITTVHVNGARQQFNLSELNKLPSARKTRLARDMAEAIRNEVMPPVDYLLLHPEARLSATEKEQLVQGLTNSLK